MTLRERLEREAADLEHAATSCWRRDTPAGQEDAQFAAAIRTVLAEHAALLAACEGLTESVRQGRISLAANFDAIRAAVALCREAPHA